MQHLTLAQWAFNAALGVALFYIINMAGDLARPVGYTDFISVYKTNAFGLNVAFRAFAPTLSIGLIAIFLYSVNLDAYVQGIWLSVVFYWLYRLGYYTVRGWLTLLPTGTLVAQVLVSFASAQYFYAFMISKGPDSLLPQVSDVTFQFWAVVIGFTYALLQAKQPSEDGQNPPLNALVRRYHSFHQRFAPALDERFSQDLVLQNILFTLMVMEDFNRSRIIRGVERILVRLGAAKTTGIMQITSPGRALTDEESVSLAQERLAEQFDDWYSDWLADSFNDAIIQITLTEPSSYSYTYYTLAWVVPITEFYATYSGNTLSHTEDVYQAILTDVAESTHLDADTRIHVMLTSRPRDGLKSR